ncbi:MAG: aminodeoxychorismate lyase [Acidimicrobiales bacterium]
MDGLLPRAWVMGNMTEAAAAVVSAFDHGLTVGDGVFETVKILRARPFASTRHLERLERSALGLGLPAPDLRTVRAAMDAVIAANAVVDDAVLRVTYTAGRGPLGSARWTDAAPTLVIAAARMRPWARTSAVSCVPWPRNERGALSGLKTTSYGENVVALAAAHRAGADEAIFANTRGELCEGTGTNIFVAVGGRMLTPPLASGCLAGVTRDLVLETGLAEEDDIPVAARHGATEAVLTSTTRDVHPIAAVDSQALPAAPGPLTATIAHTVAELAAGVIDP